LSSVDDDRRHIAMLYDRFDAERAAAERELLAAQRGSGSSPGERALRETAVRVQTMRLGRLRAGGDGLALPTPPAPPATVPRASAAPTPSTAPGCTWAASGCSTTTWSR
jgi:hypothetical protein